MGNRERPSDRGRRRAREGLSRVAGDVRLARVGAGLSLRDVANSAGLDHAQLWRFERRQIDLTLGNLSAVCSVLGLDLSIRAFPTGDAIRDAGHARLLARLRVRLHPSLRWSTEVALPGLDELRAWDAVIRGPGWRVPLEAETVLGDIQALERKLALKVRDGGVQHVLLLLADTRANRRALTSAPAAFAAQPLRNRQILALLGSGRQPTAGGIVML
jgi:transcriptional regulator with XRE-family HTH domain